MFDDRCATGVLDVLHRAGRTVPGDISVIGYEDSRLARLSDVNLTTVATRLKERSVTPAQLFGSAGSGCG